VLGLERKGLGCNLYLKLFEVRHDCAKERSDETLRPGVVRGTSGMKREDHYLAV
jgi:hypothetical protein